MIKSVRNERNELSKHCKLSENEQLVSKFMKPEQLDNGYKLARKILFNYFRDSSELHDV